MLLDMKYSTFSSGGAHGPPERGRILHTFFTTDPFSCLSIIPVFLNGSLTWRTVKQSNTAEVWKNQQDERHLRDSVLTAEHTDLKNVFLSGFLYKRELSIDLRGDGCLLSVGCSRGQGKSSLSMLRIFFSDIWHISNFIATYSPGTPVVNLFCVLVCCAEVLCKMKVVWTGGENIQLYIRIIVYKVLILVRVHASWSDLHD